MSATKPTGSALEEKKAKKRELEQAEDYLRQVDLPEGMGGGRKIVEETLKDEEATEKKAQDAQNDILEGFKQRLFSYRRQMCDYGNKLLKDLDQTWEMEFVPTDGSDIKIHGKRFKTQQGVVLVLKSPKGEVFIRAISVTMEPDMDSNAIRILLNQAENTIDSEKGILLSDKKRNKVTKGGIHLP